MKYTESNTVSLSNACRLIGTNLPRLKRLSAKNNFQILDAGCRYNRVPASELLIYLKVLSTRNTKIENHLRDGILELTSAFILEQTDEIEEEYLNNVNFPQSEESYVQ